MLIYLPIALGLLNLVVAIYAQWRLSDLLDFVRERPDIMDRIGWVSDLYFILDMSRMRYGFVRYLCRNRHAPEELAGAFPDYEQLRRISNLSYALNIALLATLILAFVTHRFS